MHLLKDACDSSQHFNLQWIFRAASSMHAERGDLGRSLFIEGLSCSMECCPDGSAPLHAQTILPHYNIPLAVMDESEASDGDHADVSVPTPASKSPINRPRIRAN